MVVKGGQPAQGPWGQNFGPLNFPIPLHPLPQGSRKNIPKFYGDKQHPNEHIVAFYITCSVLAIEHEDVLVRLFVEYLQGDVVDWFYHLAPQTIIN